MQHLFFFFHIFKGKHLKMTPAHFFSHCSKYCFAVCPSLALWELWSQIDTAANQKKKKKKRLDNGTKQLQPAALKDCNDQGCLKFFRAFTWQLEYFGLFFLFFLVCFCVECSVWREVSLSDMCWCGSRKARSCRRSLITNGWQQVATFHREIVFVK